MTPGVVSLQPGLPDYTNKLGQTGISAVKKTKKTKDKYKEKQWAFVKSLD